MEYPNVKEDERKIVVHLSPLVEVWLRTGTFDTEKTGKVLSVGLCLAPTEALAFASNITIAAQIAAAWERGDETRETILKVYGRQEG